MAHFAKIEEGKVTRVIVVKNKDCGGGEFPESEAIGQAFIASLGLAGEFFQTSYNKNFRGQYAGTGLNWNGEVFHGESPYASWLLQDDGTWAAPTEKPEGPHYWDEDSVSWINTQPG
jgi:hypothetical protein